MAELKNYRVAWVDKEHSRMERISPLKTTHQATLKKFAYPLMKHRNTEGVILSLYADWHRYIMAQDPSVGTPINPIISFEEFLERHTRK